MFPVTFYVLQGSYKKLQPFLRTFQGLFKGHIRFSRTTYFVEILQGWVGGGVISSLQIWKIQGGGGVLSENLSVVGYGYFLEPHIYDLYSALDNQKAFETTFHATKFKVEENSRTCTEIQWKMEFKDYPKIQGFFKTVQTLCNTKPCHHFFNAKDRTTCNHSNSVLFTCEDNILFYVLRYHVLRERHTWYVIGVYNYN